MNAKWQQYIHCLHISNTSVPATRWSSSFLFEYPRSPRASTVCAFRDAPSAPFHKLVSNLRSKKGYLLHGQSDPVGRHRPGLDRDPQVFGIGRIFFLLCFWPWRRHGVAAAATTAAVGMTTATAVAAHHHCCEEDEQGKRQEDHQADCVIGPLVVFFWSKVPQLVEKILNAVSFPIHGLGYRRVSPLNETISLLEKFC